ncbi:MAG: helix-turn-helix domain-containing protein [Candidatus Woesearchaeota archaeon]
MTTSNAISHQELLKACGLTQNETAVYLALLKIGASKSGAILKESGISSGKIYETLSKLVEKGLVKTHSENGVAHFSANDPETLLTYLKEKEHALHEKEEELKTILPDLQKIRTIDHKEEAVAYTKGIRGIKPLIYEHLIKGNKIIIMGVRSSKKAEYNNFWRAWHQKRTQLKKQARVLFSDENTEYWQFFKQLKFTEVREFITFTPSAIMVIDETTFIFSYDEDVICVQITSQAIAESFANFFEGLWNAAKH